MADDVDEALETLRRVGGDVGVIGNAAPAHADVAPEGEAELGLVDGGEAGVDVGLEVAGRLHMALPVSSFFPEVSSKFSIQFKLAFCICVGVFRVLEDVSRLAQLVELADLDLAVHRREGSLAIETGAEAGLVLVKGVALAFSSLEGAQKLGHTFGEAILVGALRRAKQLFCRWV